MTVHVRKRARDLMVWTSCIVFQMGHWHTVYDGRLCKANCSLPILDEFLRLVGPERRTENGLSQYLIRPNSETTVGSRGVLEMLKA